MELVGQTTQDLILHVLGASDAITWNVGKAVVVSNLGVVVLMGEPGKADNKVITIPLKKVIEIRTDNNKRIVLPYCTLSPQNKLHDVACRASKAVTLYPGE